MTVPVYAYKSTGNEFKGKLRNIDDPLNPVTVNLNGNTRLWIVFYKPDGTQSPTDEEMEADIASNATAEDLQNLADTFIVFQDFTEPSLLDQRGYWEYVPAAKFVDNIIKSPERKSFWVQ